ncbi:MAG: DUF1501 domain-containing protein [Planctomycetota bacterium]|nr:DUF1501 domain-containing protein [Planctomycetota bacterium]
MYQGKRRDFFHWGAQGIAATALLSLLERDGVVEGAAAAHPVRAKRAIHICLIGGMSHVDSFDYKPELVKYHGKPLGASEKPDIFFGQVGLLRQHDWEFKQRGNSGLWISEMWPHIAEQADDLTLLRSMVSDSANHTPALFVQNSGFQFNGFPSLGSWLSYGMGTETEALPAYVVLPDSRGGPNGGASNWTNGFLPAQHQGVVLRGGAQPVRDLFPARAIDRVEEAETREFLRLVNRKHLAQAGQDAALEARVRSYELAAQMQLSVPEVSDLAGETAATREMYGVDDDHTGDAGRRCLLGRRLLERGVRFVQIYSGGPIAGSPRASWDAHESVKQNHSFEAGRIDKPVAALLRDLKQRGMLAETLVLFTTEFGRTPFAQSAANQVGPGRDHNRYGFSCWMAGAGLKPGTSYGATDDIGWKAVENPMPWHDFHATVLHLFGIDHERLTFYHNGIRRRLTNVHGDVADEIFA